MLIGLVSHRRKRGGGFCPLWSHRHLTWPFGRGGGREGEECYPTLTSNFVRSAAARTTGNPHFSLGFAEKKKGKGKPRPSARAEKRRKGEGDVVPSPPPPVPGGGGGGPSSSFLPLSIRLPAPPDSGGGNTFRYYTFSFLHSLSDAIPSPSSRKEEGAILTSLQLLPANQQHPGKGGDLLPFTISLPLSRP